VEATKTDEAKLVASIKATQTEINAKLRREAETLKGKNTLKIEDFIPKVREQHLEEAVTAIHIFKRDCHCKTYLAYEKNVKSKEACKDLHDK